MNNNMMLKSNKYKLLLLLFILMVIPIEVLGCGIKTTETDKEIPQKKYTILGLGDSITEGGSAFKTYLHLLSQQLFTARYNVEFIGPNSDKSGMSNIKNAGYGGKNVEFLENCIDSIYTKYPANIVLLHAGHNHFSDENPVPGIVAAHKSIIKKIKAINPEVEIFVAQIITSGKLPKYSYIPKLNQQILLMVKQLHDEGHFVTIVNQAKGFNWKVDTIEDKVHPNEKGAKKMADKWFSSLIEILEKNTKSLSEEKIAYQCNI